LFNNFYFISISSFLQFNVDDLRKWQGLTGTRSDAVVCALIYDSKMGDFKSFFQPKQDLEKLV